MIVLSGIKHVLITQFKSKTFQVKLKFITNFSSRFMRMFNKEHTKVWYSLYHRKDWWGFPIAQACFYIAKFNIFVPAQVSCKEAKIYKIFFFRASSQKSLKYWEKNPSRRRFGTNLFNKLDPEI